MGAKRCTKESMLQQPPAAQQPPTVGMISPEPITRDDVPILRALVESTASATGEAFFQTLVRHLASAIDVHYAFVAEFATPTTTTRARTLAFWARDHLQENVEWTLAGTPCEDVVRGNLCHHPKGVSQKFPDDKPLIELGIDSYLGVPLRGVDGDVLGHLAVFDERPMPAEPRRLFIFRIFAARAAAELQRLRAQQQLLESERRYRGLYEEAPTGYLSVGVEGRIRTVNRLVTEWLGYAAEALVGSPVLNLVAATSKPRAEECFRKLVAGEEVRGVELELCRKDGRPLWVSLWVKPMREADGTVFASRSIWVDITDRVLAEAERARLQQQNLYLQEELKSVHNFEEIIGQGPALLTVLDNVCRVAPTEASVLISGETVTGKELIARALHSASRRKEKPLIKVNCAALPTGLVESELFGHEKGAFTGAISRRIGRFELADGGTIFLDEIGEIPPDAQAKLLRVLQEREFERVGGSAAIRVDVRVIAASNRDLLKAVREKTFREDLYYRLNVFPILLPPLRERTEDIPLLAHFFLNKFAARIGKSLQGISRQTMQRLLAYSWPGNVRELENILERAVILAQGDALEISPDILSPSTSTDAGQGLLDLATLARNHILTTLEQTGWVIDGPHGAAKVLGLHPNTLRSRLKKLDIHRFRVPTADTTKTPRTG